MYERSKHDERSVYTLQINRNGLKRESKSNKRTGGNNRTVEKNNSKK